MLTLEQVARVCHEANRGLCEALGDMSQPKWDDAPAWQRDSAIAGVAFHRANPDATAAASHESWLAQKQREGWCWGPTKDPDRREHPCYVPFAELPPEQQAKDFLFRGIVHALTPDR